MPDAQKLSDKMQPLRQKYLEQLKEKVVHLETLHRQCSAGDLNSEMRADLRLHAHKLSGTGATYGFPTISATGRQLEESLIDHGDASGSFFAEQVQQLLDACAEAIVGHVPSSVPPIPQQPVADALFPSCASSLPLLLVVDDDEHVGTLLQELFKNDARILMGTNAGEALQLMQQHQPDLVLMDDMMPGGVSGLKLLEQRQSMAEIAGIPVIMITANRKADEVLRGLMAGAVDYVTKPFKPEELSGKVIGRLKRIHSPILLVDDDEAVRELLSHKLRNAGCKVMCAADGEQAWSLMQKHDFALTVLDRMMPGYDGMTLMRRMKDNPRLGSVPVIFLTARHYGADVLEGLDIGAADYITKPFNPDEVVVRCLKLLRSSAAQTGT